MVTSVSITKKHDWTFKHTFKKYTVRQLLVNIVEKANSDKKTQDAKIKRQLYFKSKETLPLATGVNV